MTDLIQRCADFVGLTRSEIEQISRSAASRYKVFTVPKRSGGRRIIAQPAREVKLLQRALIKLYWSKFPIHPAATAYATGRSIKDNADLHATNHAIGKLDFSNFFHSFDEAALKHFISTQSTVSDIELEFLLNSALWWGANGKLVLSIGAPSSPAITNALMCEFDKAALLTLPTHCTYSRYADDITVSAGSATDCVSGLDSIEAIAVQWTNPKLTINEKKRVLVYVGRRRTVTGVVLNDRGERSLGRTRKRAISAGVHQAIKGRLEADEISRLQGLLSFAHDIEPSFIDRLKTKYGADNFASLMRKARSRES